MDSKQHPVVGDTDLVVAGFGKVQDAQPYKRASTTSKFTIPPIRLSTRKRIYCMEFSKMHL